MTDPTDADRRRAESFQWRMLGIRTAADGPTDDRLEWLVRGLIPIASEDGFVGEMWGPSKGGKTFVALDLALSVANVLPSWFGFPIEPVVTGHVIYFDLEGGAALDDRIDAWIEGHPGATRDRLVTVTPSDGFDLNDAKGVAKYVGALRRATADEWVALVVVDTLRAAAPNLGDERGNTELYRLVRTAKERLGDPFAAPVLLVHHSNDDARLAAGAPSQRAALDFEIRVAKGAVSVPAVKHAERPDASIRFQLVKAGKSAYAAPAVHVPKRSGGDDDVLAAAARFPDSFTVVDIEPFVPIQRRQLQRRLDRLADVGTIECVEEAINGGAANRPARYRMTNA